MQRENLNDKMESVYANASVFETEINDIENKITNGLALTISCDFWQGSVFDKPKVLKFTIHIIPYIFKYSTLYFVYT